MNTTRQQELAQLREIALAEPEIVKGHARYVDEALKENLGSDVAEFLMGMVKRTRDWPQLHCDVIAELERGGRGRLVYASLCKVRADNPDGPLVGYLLGVSLSIRRDYERAAIGFRAALKCMPDLAAAHFLLGVGYQQQRDFPNALAEWDRALAMSPQMAEPYFAIGVMEAQQGNMGAASAKMRAFLERAGKYLGLYRTVALKHLEMAERAVADVLPPRSPSDFVSEAGIRDLLRLPNSPLREQFLGREFFSFHEPGTPPPMIDPKWSAGAKAEFSRDPTLAMVFGGPNQVIFRSAQLEQMLLKKGGQIRAWSDLLLAYKQCGYSTKHMD